MLLNSDLQVTSISYSGRKDATTLFATNSSVLRVTILSIRVVLPGGGGGAGLKGSVIAAKITGHNETLQNAKIRIQNRSSAVRRITLRSKVRERTVSMQAFHLTSGESLCSHLI